MEQLQPWLESREYQVGERLTLQGKVQEGMHLVISGQASVYDSGGGRL